MKKNFNEGNQICNIILSLWDICHSILFRIRQDPEWLFRIRTGTSFRSGRIRIRIPIHNTAISIYLSQSYVIFIFLFFVLSRFIFRLSKYFSMPSADSSNIPVPTDKPLDNNQTARVPGGYLESKADSWGGREQSGPARLLPALLSSQNLLLKDERGLVR
jgi:hypothetical protein